MNIEAEWRNLNANAAGGGAGEVEEVCLSVFPTFCVIVARDILNIDIVFLIDAPAAQTHVIPLVMCLLSQVAFKTHISMC